MNLWDGLKSDGAIEWTAPSLEISLDTAASEEDLAKALAETVSSNLSRGKRPDGRPLPQASAATLERRAYRRAQAARGGQASPRVTDPAKRARVKQNWDKRMAGARPANSATQVGLESGLLARSIRAERAMRGWVLVVAGERGQRGAAARVFARLGGLGGLGGLGAGVMQQPAVRAAMGRIVKRIFKAD